ncbi:hypothetical protein [uncultured Amnibacterium sp.]|uniref:hypothetical protein n=1 Tax=uncultured Amnibacterium sp. TaxID=1631851 RepID=UPI0035CAF746
MTSVHTRYASRLSGFAAATALTGAVGFMTIPVLISAGGAQTWAVLAFGQAIGGVGMVLTGWGWNISGAAEAALLDRDQANELLLRSVAIRLKLVVPVCGAAAAVAFLLAPADPVLAATSAAAFSLNGLSAAWFYTGMRAPRTLIVREVVPRTAFIVLGLLVCLLTRSIGPFPAFLAAGCLAAVVLNVTGAGGSPFGLFASHGRNSLPELRRQLPAVFTTLTSTLYLATPTVFVGLIAPQDLAIIALADRLFKTVNMAASPILNVLQGAIPSRDPDVFRQRVRKGLTAVLGLGVGGGVLFAVGAPLVAPLISGGQTQLPLAVTIPFGLTVLATYLSQVVGLSCLITLGRVRSVAISATVGAVIGVPVLLVGSALAGAAGAAVGEAIAEVAVTVYQLWSLRNGMRRL